MSKATKIFVVDDVVANLEVVVTVLAAAGYKVATATSGNRALKRLETYTPDLILLDIHMPKLDGFAVCEQIKANPKTAKIPIIFITALSDMDSVSKGFTLGAVDYITKPFREAELLVRINTHIQLRQVNQTLEKRVQERTQALSQLLQQLKDSQVRLIQQEKMSALGNLVAGVAHEINNPISCISGNVLELESYLADIFSYIRLCQNQTSPKEQENVADKIDLAFLLDDIPKMMTSVKNACDRIVDISKSLRSFSRIDPEKKTAADLHEGLDSSLLILKHRLKANDNRPQINVVKRYANLPEILCFPGQLSQVFMNLLANAIDALDDGNKGKTYQQIQTAANQITIQTGCADNQIVIHIKDNGIGMSDQVKKRIFDHLYTTKEIGRGTGLGLAIAKQIIVETHGGKIEVESEAGQGTEFIVTLPIEQADITQNTDG